MPEYEVFVGGKPKKIELSRTGESSFTVKMDGENRSVELSPNTLSPEKPFPLKVNNKTYQIELPMIDQGKEFSVKVNEVTLKAEVKIPAKKVALTSFEPVTATPAKRAVANKRIVEGAISASMTGKIVSVKVKKGDLVKAGQVLCVIEAMKMENEITASKAGSVKEVFVTEGSSVGEGEPLLIIG